MCDDVIANRSFLDEQNEDTAFVTAFEDSGSLLMQSGADAQNLIKDLSPTTTSKYSCDSCEQTYDTKKSLILHIRAQHTTKIISLNISGKKTSHGIYRCEICNTGYNDILSHIEAKHSGETYQCKICQKRTSNKKNLKQHLKLHQRKNEKTKSDYAFICKICEKGHRTKTELSKHIISNHTTYKCTECDVFVYHGELVDHRAENIVESKEACYKEVKGSEKVECQKCGIKFVSTRGVKLHYMHVHRKQKSCVDRSSHKCDVCHAHFPNSETLEQHRCGKEVVSLLDTYKQEYQGDDFECKICKKLTRDKLSLMQHQIRRHRLDKRTCEFCNKTLKNAGMLTKHISYHVQKSCTCDECGVQLNSFYALTLHRQCHHRDGKQSNKIKYHCDVCGVDFTTPHSLRSHSFRMHSIAEKDTETFACDMCEKVYIAKCTLNSHKKAAHSNERPHKCPCGKSFKTKNCFNRHQLQVHGNDRVECKICGKVFMSRTALKAHTVVHGEKRHECKECGKCFYRKAQWSYHMNSHTGNRPYKCNVCGKGFTMDGARDRHMPLHTGEKRYKCDVCGMAFNQKCSLTRHVRLHTGEKPYKCELCGMSFTQGSSLTGHKKVHHGQEISLTEK